MKIMMRSISLAIFAALMLAGGQVLASGDKKEEKKSYSYFVKSLIAGGAAWGSSFLSKELLMSALNKSLSENS